LYPLSSGVLPPKYVANVSYLVATYSSGPITRWLTSCISVCARLSFGRDLNCSQIKIFKFLVLFDGSTYAT
jgi:hypothetical protein